MGAMAEARGTALVLSARCLAMVLALLSACASPRTPPEGGRSGAPVLALGDIAPMALSEESVCRVEQQDVWIEPVSFERPVLGLVRVQVTDGDRVWRFEGQYGNEWTPGTRMIVLPHGSKSAVGGVTPWRGGWTGPRLPEDVVADRCEVSFEPNVVLFEDIVGGEFGVPDRDHMRGSNQLLVPERGYLRLTFDWEGAKDCDDGDRPTLRLAVLVGNRVAVDVRDAPPVAHLDVGQVSGEEPIEVQWSVDKGCISYELRWSFGQ